MNTVVILYHNYWQEVRNLKCAYGLNEGKCGPVHTALMGFWWEAGVIIHRHGWLDILEPTGRNKTEPREQGRQTQSCSRVESAYSLYCTFMFGFALTTSWHDVYAVQKTHRLVVLSFTPWKPEITTYTRLLSIQVHILYFFIYFSFSFYHQWQCLQHASKSSFWQTTNKLKHS